MLAQVNPQSSPHLKTDFNSKVASIAFLIIAVKCKVFIMEFVMAAVRHFPGLEN